MPRWRSLASHPISKIGPAPHRLASPPCVPGKTHGLPNTSGSAPSTPHQSGCLPSQGPNKYSFISSFNNKTSAKQCLADWPLFFCFPPVIWLMENSSPAMALDMKRSQRPIQSHSMLCGREPFCMMPCNLYTLSNGWTVALVWHFSTHSLMAWRHKPRSNVVNAASTYPNVIGSLAGEISALFSYSSCTRAAETLAVLSSSFNLSGSSILFSNMPVFKQFSAVVLLPISCVVLYSSSKHVRHRLFTVSVRTRTR